MSDGRRENAWVRVLLAEYEWELALPRWVRLAFVFTLPVSLAIHFALWMGPMALWFAWAVALDSLEREWRRTPGR